MRSVVVLPQPDGPTSTTNSSIGNVEVDAADGFGVAVPFDDIAQGQLGHVALLRPVFPAATIGGSNGKGQAMVPARVTRSSAVPGMIGGLPPNLRFKKFTR